MQIKNLKKLGTMVRVDNIETQVIDNSGSGNDVEKMYTAPVDVAQAYEASSPPKSVNSQRS